jgi:predicted Fe-Mo cluster-binding NifX family protein
MKIAIPIWNDCVSSVFDFAGKLSLVEMKNGKEISRSEALLESQSLSQRVGQLKSLEVDVLICGAISRALANMVTASGIKVLPYVTGSIDDVLQAYLTGQLVKPKFSMPGCWPGARKGFRNKHGGRCGCGRGHRGGRGKTE